MCVCLCARSACTLPLLASVCGLGVCVWARVSAAPRNCWLACWGVCVLCACSACTPPLLAGLCSVGVCVWARVAAAPRHSWLGFLGLCVSVCALRLVPYHSWLGRAVRLCLLGLGFRLRPATPGWGVEVCVCLCARYACTPPLLAGVCGVGVCAWARVSGAPRHSWLGCWGVCVCLCACSACTLPLLVWVCGVGVCVWARVSAAPRRSWLGCWAVCVSVRALRFVPCGSWPGRAVRVCVLRLGFRLRPATPGLGVGMCVSVCVPASLVPRHSWLGCAVWVCLLELEFRLCPATPGWGVRCWCVCLGSASAVPRHCWLGCWDVLVFVCALRLYPATPGRAVQCGRVCLGSGCGCAPPLLAGVLGFVCLCVRAPLGPLPLLAGACGAAVFAWARVSAAPRHSWLGC